MLNFDDISTYSLILNICSRYQVDPSSSIKMEDYFRSLLKQFQGNPEKAQIESWLEEQLSHSFISVDNPPRWIQNAEWPIVNGEPMQFVGQIDVIANEGSAAQMFHDDTSFYIFVAAKVNPVVIT